MIWLGLGRRAFRLRLTSFIIILGRISSSNWSWMVEVSFFYLWKSWICKVRRIASPQSAPIQLLPPPLFNIYSPTCCQLDKTNYDGKPLPGYLGHIYLHFLQRTIHNYMKTKENRKHGGKCDSTWNSETFIYFPSPCKVLSDKIFTFDEQMWCNEFLLYCSLPKFKHNNQLKGFAFIEFSTAEEAQKACQVRDLNLT